MKSTVCCASVAKTIGVIGLGIVLMGVGALLIVSMGACTQGTDGSAFDALGNGETATPAPRETTMITQSPKISGVPILPDLEIDGVELAGVTLYDLAWNEIASDKDGNPEYCFTVDPGSSYILVADYSIDSVVGPALAAVTPTVIHDIEQNINVDTEVAANLIVATEQAHEDLLPGSLSRPLDDLLDDAYDVVARLNAFYSDRNRYRRADRVADAIHALTMDRLNRGGCVYSEELNEDVIRAYGGGLDGIRCLEDMLDDNLPPLNPHFVFTRQNYNSEVDFGMSDLETKRWDFMGANGMSPHIVTGGNKVVYVGPTDTEMASIDAPILGLFVRSLGTSTSSARLITPWNMDCWTPSWSPDQSKIAFAGRYISSPSSTRPPVWRPLNIFVIDVGTREITQLTDYYQYVSDRLEGCLNPSWSPDGETIIFDHSVWNSADTIARLETVELDSPGSPGLFLDNGDYGIQEPFSPRYSPDGHLIAFNAFVADGGSTLDNEIVVAAANHRDGGPIYQITENSYDDSNPDWSYDGRFLVFSSDRGREPSRVSTSGYLKPFYVVNVYTGEMVTDLGDFANAGVYYGARFCATEAVMATVEGTTRDSRTGDAVIGGSDYRTSSTGNSDYNYYRETIPAANNIVDAYGSPAYNYGVTSWW